MQKLLSLPPNLVQSFHELERVNRTDWFCTSDPVGKKLGSGGGTSHCLKNVIMNIQMVLLLESGLKKKKNSSSCGWAKPPFTRLCTFWKDSHSGSCVPVGERATSGTKSAFSATSLYEKIMSLARINSIH